MNLVNACGVAAWQTVFHFHIHVVPRYAGRDGLEMPWIPPLEIRWRSPKPVLCCADSQLLVATSAPGGCPIAPERLRSAVPR